LWAVIFSKHIALSCIICNLHYRVLHQIKKNFSAKKLQHSMKNKQLFTTK